MLLRTIFSSLFVLSSFSLSAEARDADNGLLKIARQHRELGLSKNSLLKTVQFIETELPKHAIVKEYFLPKTATGLPYAIEYDPKQKSCFIILEGKNAYVGKGKKKVVYKAIKYDPNSSFLVARAEECTKKARELKLTRKLHGSYG